jgi:CRP/FNR family transcriptional regulator, cyclic AMP receptor protein
MIERFRDRRRLLDALLLQKLINGDAEVTEAVADVVELREYAVGDTLIAQDGIDDHVCLILAGGVDIVVNGRSVAKRSASEHVGEMSLLSPDSRRSAAVVANAVTVVGCVSEESFSNIAGRWPILWRRIASSLADRLRQRGQYVRQRNETPIMFVGSSTEGLELREPFNQAWRTTMS